MLGLMETLLTIIVSIIASVITTIASVSFYWGKKVEQIDNLKESNKELKGKVEELNNTVIELKTKVNICLPLSPANPLAKTKSPISLTEEGNNARKTIRADEIFENHKKHLYAQLDKSKLNNAYDIQVETFKVIDENLFKSLNEQEMILLKNEAYKAGQPLEFFLIIFQIILRDCVLKEKGMLISDVDKHDPEITKP